MTPNLPPPEHHLLNNAPQKPTEKQETFQPIIGSLLPPAFWDNLSTIPLTKNALIEFDGRNAQKVSIAPLPSDCRSHPRFTGRALTEAKKTGGSVKLAIDTVSSCIAGNLKNIKIFGRHGGADLSDLIGYSVPPDNLRRTRSSSKSSRGESRQAPTANTQYIAKPPSTKNIGPYDRAFQQHLIDHGCYPDEYEYPDGRVPPQPSNWEEINERLKRPRPSLSPSQFSDGQFKRFKRADAYASEEMQVEGSVIPIIGGEVRDLKCVSGGIPYSNLKPLTDGTLVPGNPNIYHGARPEQLDRRVRTELSGHIIPSTQEDLPPSAEFLRSGKGAKRRLGGC